MAPQKKQKTAAKSEIVSDTQTKVAVGKSMSEAKPSSQNKQEQKSSISIPDQLQPQLELSLRLSNEITDSRKNLNHLIPLLKLCESSHDKVVISTVLRVREIFSTVIQSGDLTIDLRASKTQKQTRAPTDDAHSAAAEWLESMVFRFFDVCINHVQRPNSAGVQAAAMQTIMKVCSNFQRQPDITSFVLRNLPIQTLVKVLLLSKYVHEATITMFLDDFASHPDVGLEIFEAISSITESKEKFSKEDFLATADPSVVRRIYQFLQMLPKLTCQKDITPFMVGPTPTSPEDELNLAALSALDSLDPDDDGLGLDSATPQKKGKNANAKQGKKRSQPESSGSNPSRAFYRTYHKLSINTWLGFFKMPMPVDLYKLILSQIHDRVIPRFPSPLVLFDFLVNSYNIGGVVSLLSLNGLFILITKYNLNYPDFYTKLYALLTPSVLRVKYRGRFFQLLATFLSSSYIPSYVVAAFAKRLARLTLTAPPSGSLIVIPFIYNLLVQHQACRKMLHRERESDETEETDPNPGTKATDTTATTTTQEKVAGDPYNHEEQDPLKTNAIESSLWELATLSKHYCPAVSRMVKLLEKSFKKNEPYRLEDFLEQSHSAIFETELRRKMKSAPALTFQKPTALFEAKDISSDFAVWEIVQPKPLPSA
eukprot:TRINITY_DN4232_c0_g1_i2.p1 TRINITY_DN4232_c0_g1~~TRINITY_DN4232_c0_g1_i2.p1  ORF type:complete len:653 (+),score=149.54 TRINITY_DN4232_c0_g1_i2:54-2012(+)